MLGVLGSLSAPHATTAATHWTFGATATIYPRSHPIGWLMTACQDIFELSLRELHENKAIEDAGCASTTKTPILFTHIGTDLGRLCPFLSRCRPSLERSEICGRLASKTMATRCNISYILLLPPKLSSSPFLTTAQGDTKYGVLIGTDRWGNKYYENLEEELPLRTRWVRSSGNALFLGTNTKSSRLTTRITS